MSQKKEIFQPLWSRKQLVLGTLSDVGSCRWGGTCPLHRGVLLWHGPPPGCFWGCWWGLGSLQEVTQLLWAPAGGR